jgi:hypothetical protein
MRLLQKSALSVLQSKSVFDRAPIEVKRGKSLRPMR